MSTRAFIIRQCDSVYCSWLKMEQFCLLNPYKVREREREKGCVWTAGTHVCLSLLMTLTGVCVLY